jgi:hypothetical protein
MMVQVIRTPCSVQVGSGTGLSLTTIISKDTCSIHKHTLIYKVYIYKNIAMECSCIKSYMKKRIT